MKILGIDLVKPTFWQFTVAVAIGIVFWVLLVALGVTSKTPVGAGATLAATVFGSVSNACGVDVKKGWKHLLLNVGGCIAVLVLYQVIASIF